MFKTFTTSFWMGILSLLLMPRFSVAAVPENRPMATIIVTNTSDGVAPGPVGSLRRAINDAAPGDIINFNLPNPSTITLTNGHLLITKALTITGPGATALTIDGNANDRVFWLVNAPLVSISGLTITNGSSDFGGGISAQNSILSLNACAITGNQAISGAAGVNIHTGSTATITNCTISGNTSGGQCGGVQVNDATATLTNCTISGNMGTVATGVLGLQFSTPTTVTLINCTVASHHPHGVYTQAAAIILQNTIVASNTQNFVRTMGGTTTSLGNNLDTDGRSGFNNGVNGDIVGTTGSPINALLSSLNNYGGPTSTLALLPGSPAINAGTNIGAPTLDQRSIARTGSTDIGAFESQGFTLAIASGNNQTALINTAFANPLSVTVSPNSAGEPVNGGSVTFTPPGSGAGATIAGNPATIAAGAATTGTVTANGTGGTYNVVAGAHGAASSINFSLTNNVAPTVLSIVRGNASPTNNGSVPFNVTFSENVTGVTNSNFAVVASGVVGASVTSVIGSGSTRVVMVNTGTGSGTLGLNMTNSTGVTDSQGAAISNLTFTGEAYTIDKTAPTAGLSAGNVTTAGATSYTFTVTYTDNAAVIVASLDNSDVTVTGPGGPLAVTFTGVTPSGNGTPRTASYSIIPPGGSWDNADGGAYTITMAAGQVTDAVGNAVAAGTLGTFQVVICNSVLTINDLGDTDDATPGDGICADASGNCTLRAAIQEANATPLCSPMTINFSVAGGINLATALPNLNHPNLTITGPGAANLTVARNSSTLFRIFTISAGQTVTISGLKITNGLAPGTNSGGGVFNAGTLSLSQCVISGNAIETTSVGGASFGGGIYSAGPLTIDRCEISGNSGRSGAGITHNGLGSGFPLIITNSTISGNTGVQSGGFDIRNTSASLTNCTISGNIAPGRIGGIDQVAQSGNTSSLLLTNCTVTNNTGSAAIETFGFAGVTSLTTTLRNTLVAGNVGANFTTTLGTVTSLGNNLDSDGASGFTNGANGDIVGASSSPINALLAPLGNYGEPTRTHALLPGSPAINAGTSIGAPTLDQRGIARTGATDIGAFESQGFTLAIAGGNNQTALINTAFANPLSVTVTPNSAGEPVNGGWVIFTPPGSGAGATIAGNPATIAASAATSGTVTANTLSGSYSVTANTTPTPTNSVSFNLTNSCPAFTVGTPASPAVIDQIYSSSVAATPAAPGGFSYQYSLANSTMLPAGLMLNTGTGAITGTPSALGNVSFDIKVELFNAGNVATGCTVTQTRSINIICVAPSFTACPSDGVGVNTPANACTATATYSVAANGMPAPVLTYTFTGATMGAGNGTGSGSTFNVGTTQVTVTATNVCGAPTCSFTVTVTDNTPPTITCPATQTLVLGANCTASLPDYTGLATTGDNCGVQGVTQSPEPGTTVSGAGNETVTLTVTDVNGLTNFCTFMVTKVDNTPPTLVCKANTVLLNATGNYTLLAVDVFDAVASFDNCSGELAVTNISPATVNCSQLGQTIPVTVTVQDAAGNSAACIAQITVQEGTAIPAGWSSNNVGNANGSSGYKPCTSEGQFTVAATGFSTSSSDVLHLTARQLCGNGEIIARVASVSSGGWAGITLRESLAQGSKKVGLKTQLTTNIRREIRTATNGTASILNFFRPQHTWLRLVRNGSNFVGYTSYDGTTWAFAFSATVSMTGCIHAGLFAESVNNNVITTAVFDNVSVTGAVAPLVAPNGTVEATVAAPDFEVYPNPTTGEVTVDLSAYANRSVRLEVYDIQGKVLKVLEIESVETATERLDLSAYQNGIYLIRVQSVGVEHFLPVPDATKRVVLAGIKRP